MMQPFEQRGCFSRLSYRNDPMRDVSNGQQYMTNLSRKRGGEGVKARKSHMLMPLYGPSLFRASSNVKSLTAFLNGLRLPMELDGLEEKKDKPS